jgi:N-methylhydantoinase A
VPLDAEAAGAGLTRLGDGLGLGREACAAGVVEIAAWNQANAIRQVTVRKGIDVRELALVTFGGSGSLQACRLLDVLGLSAVVVPPDPGNVSAYGLLTVDVRNDEVQTHVTRVGDADPARLATFYAELEERARVALDAEGFARSDQRVERSADLRYDGQAYEVRVAAPAGPVDGAFLDAVVAAFHDEHEGLYEYCYRDDPDAVVELVNLRVAGIGPIVTPAAREQAAGRGAEAVGKRPVLWGDEMVETPLYERAALGAGDTIDGPAVVEEFGSTVPLAPGVRAEVDPHGNLVLRKA